MEASDQPPTIFPAASFGDTTTVYDGAGRLFWVNLNMATLGISIVQVNPATGGVVAGPFNVSMPPEGQMTSRFR